MRPSSLWIFHFNDSIQNWIEIVCLIKKKSFSHVCTKIKNLIATHDNVAIIDNESTDEPRLMIILMFQLKRIIARIKDSLDKDLFLELWYLEQRKRTRFYLELYWLEICPHLLLSKRLSNQPTSTIHVSKIWLHTWDSWYHNERFKGCCMLLSSTVQENQVDTKQRIHIIFQDIMKQKNQKNSQAVPFLSFIICYVIEEYIEQWN